MSLTPEQNAEIVAMRQQIQGLLESLNKLARDVGADPIPMPSPQTGTPVAYKTGMIPDFVLKEAGLDNLIR